MNRTLPAEIEKDPVLLSAAHWFLELRSNNVSGERIAEWQQWLAQDGAHREAFGRIEATWKIATEADATPWPMDAEVAADEYDGQMSISEWHEESVRAREYPPSARGYPARWMPRRLGTARVALAASLLLGIVTLSNWQQTSVVLRGGTRIAVTTEVGETRTLTLPDGSTMTVGGRSSLVATFLDQSRTVALRQGQAYFHVAKDPRRPFTVEAGTMTVTAIGTAFDVRRTTERVVVAVADGVVNISTPMVAAIESKAPVTAAEHTDQLTAGQQLSLESQTGAPQVASVDTRDVAGWRNGRIQYLNEPLDLVVADLARYSSRRINIADAHAADLRVTGIVFAQNIDGWLSSLEATFPLRVIREADGEIRLESAP